MSTWTLYWLMKLDMIHTLFGGVWVGSLIIFGIFAVLGLALLPIILDEEKIVNTINKFKVSFLLKLWVTLAIIALLIDVFLPTTKQMCALIIVPKVVNGVLGNEKLMNLPDQIVDLGTEWLEELKPDKETQK